jgi:hypothetical protein
MQFEAAHLSRCLSAAVLQPTETETVASPGNLESDLGNKRLDVDQLYNRQMIQQMISHYGYWRHGALH